MSLRNQALESAEQQRLQRDADALKHAREEGERIAALFTEQCGLDATYVRTETTKRYRKRTREFGSSYWAEFSTRFVVLRVDAVLVNAGS